MSMGKRELRQMLTAVRSGEGQFSAGPIGVRLQSWERMSAPISPPPDRKPGWEDAAVVTGRDSARPEPRSGQSRERFVEGARGTESRGEALEAVALVGRVDPVLGQREAADDRGDAALGEGAEDRDRAAGADDHRGRARRPLEGVAGGRER